MNISQRIKGRLKMLFSSQAKQDFDFVSTEGTEVVNFLTRCVNIYKGNPEWIDVNDDIRTVNFAKAICAEVAKLTLLETLVTVSGSPRADWMQKQIKAAYPKLRQWVEYAAAYGTVILKPNGEGIDCYTPEDFMLSPNGDRESAVFRTQRYDEQRKKYFTRLEYHRFVDDEYHITSRFYAANTPNTIGDQVDISATPWAGLIEADRSTSDIDKPLFAILRMPGANNIDAGSALSLPIYADAIEELKDLDIAYSRNATEIYDSQRTVLLDSDKLVPSASGEKVNISIKGFEMRREQLKLPRYVRNVYGNGQESFYQEINPTLDTEKRLTGINALLSQIGFKCGFSNGYFVFNEKTGMMTATQVESDDRRTIQLIKDIRDQLQTCIESLLYAMDKIADLYYLSPVGPYEASFDFGDITYNHAEDKATWYSYVVAGKIPFWYYLVKFEGMTEEDAKALESEAKPKIQVFGEPE